MLRAFIRPAGKRRSLALALLPTLLFVVDAGAENNPQAAPAGTLASAITFTGGDRRESLAHFAARIGLGSRELAARYGATGIVRCGSAVGTAQLVLAADVITTAAHNLFDQTGRLRDNTERCRFEITVAGEPQVVPLDLQRAVSGSSSPYAAPAVNDWAVVRLVRPVSGVSPYPLAGTFSPPAAVTLYAAARADGSAGSAIETCAAHRVINSAVSGVRELALDCSGESGTSGAAFLTADGRFAGIYVGFRSRAPQIAAPFSDEHYNFGVTAEGDFRRALIAAAASPEYTSGTR